MTTDGAIDLFNGVLITVAKVGGPLLLAALVMGLIVGVLQAATQVNEASITFVVKMLAIAAMIALVGPWSVRQLTDYTTRTISSISTIVR